MYILLNESEYWISSRLLISTYHRLYGETLLISYIHRRIPIAGIELLNFIFVHVSQICICLLKFQLL